MAHKTPKLLKLPVHPCARTVAVFLFSNTLHGTKSIKTCAGYGVMGSKPPALWQSEPANRLRFARRIPSTECVMTHSHLLTISPVGKMTQMSLQGDTPPDPCYCRTASFYLFENRCILQKRQYAGNGNFERKCPFMSKERERKIPIQVYLSENEKYVLDNKIKASKMRNISEYIRHLILDGYVYDIDYNGLKEYSYQIAALGRNINMIRERIMKTGNAYEEDLNEIKELRDKIWHTHESMLSKVPLQKL